VELVDHDVSNEYCSLVIYHFIPFLFLQGEAGVPGFRGTPGIPVSVGKLYSETNTMGLSLFA
jgi:hypothetical protein